LDVSDSLDISLSLWGEVSCYWITFVSNQLNVGRKEWEFTLEA